MILFVSKLRTIGYNADGTDSDSNFIVFNVWHSCIYASASRFCLGCVILLCFALAISRNGVLNGGIMNDTFDLSNEFRLDALSLSESSGNVKESPRLNFSGHLPLSTEQSVSHSEPDEIYVFDIPSPTFHPPENPPWCDRCLKNNRKACFNINCSECSNNLDGCSISHIFAIMRQWSRQIQTNIISYIDKVSEL